MLLLAVVRALKEDQAYMVDIKEVFSHFAPIYNKYRGDFTDYGLKITPLLNHWQFFYSYIEEHLYGMGKFGFLDYIKKDEEIRVGIHSEPLKELEKRTEDSLDAVLGD